MQSVDEYYRFCPNQPKILISDAICLGRRRASYPFCRGCQFNDDEKGVAARGNRAGVLSVESRYSARAAEERSAAVERVFQAYDVRATYPDRLNEEIAWRIGFATASFLHTSLRGVDRCRPEATTVVVGRDMRRSSPSLSSAFVQGARAAGSPVCDIGMIDTPQMYFAVNQVRACGGAQTTASHNPAHYNGFKISATRGGPVGADTGLADICRIAQNTTRHDTGKEGPLWHRDLSQEYKAFVRSFLDTPRRLRICIDASNGMAGKWVPIIFGDVAELELVCLNMEHKGEFVHEPNPLVEENLGELRQAVSNQGADFGVCFDGDADRVVFVDEHAEILRSDTMTALLAARFLQRSPGATVVYDIRSSRTVAEEIRKAGGVPRRERVGHAFMKKALSESRAVFGGELSGHYYFKDNFYCDSGLLALVHVINTLTKEEQSLGALVAPLKRSFCSGERNFTNPDKDETIAALGERYADGRVDFLDGVTIQYSDWWCNVRKSNTEPLLRLNVEANTAEVLAEKLEELASQLGEPVQPAAAELERS